MHHEIQKLQAWAILKFPELWRFHHLYEIRRQSKGALRNILCNCRLRKIDDLGRQDRHHFHIKFTSLVPPIKLLNNSNLTELLAIDPLTRE
ncbi:unnamed protein product [Allacma fusca]|uniref:Uncharacterized protein n=1 Tax=Allacma fusca TaxID=39272 RepID=A0A8J2NZY5_9HEXA|nr:unnamed protein product [Allacma fusca]